MAQHIWHPCTQMKDCESFSRLNIVSAKGSYLELANGRKVIDAISSWWCKSLGHQHKQLKEALQHQAEKFEHAIFANTTNDIIETLSARLCHLTTSLNHIFYANEGSTAVEIALKMSLHSRHITGEKHKTKFMALNHAYHGESAGALSVSDLQLYKQAYKPMLFETHFITGIPYVNALTDPLSLDCSSVWPSIEEQLNRHAVNCTALIIEPLIQGAGGMKLYSLDLLRRLRKWTLENNIHLIADEIMTGMARTGKMLACNHAEIEPDIICLGKGLTAGWLPFSAVLIKNEIYQLFYADYQLGKNFLHSNTFSGNVLAANIALTLLDIIEEDKICLQAEILGNKMLIAMHAIALQTGKLSNLRQIGAIVAADIVCADKSRRIGFEVSKQAANLGALLRPLDNTLYWMPPINMEESTLEELTVITAESLRIVSG